MNDIYIYIYIYHISWDISWYIKLVGGLEHEFYCSIDWEFNHPNWRFVIFFRGVGQPPTSFMIFISAFLLVKNCHCWWLQCVHTYFQLLLTNGNSRILNWRYCTIFLAIFCGDIPANIGLKKIGLVSSFFYARYLQWIESWNGHWINVIFGYPLVNIQKAIEHGHWNSGFSH